MYCTLITNASVRRVENEFFETVCLFLCFTTVGSYASTFNLRLSRDQHSAPRERSLFGTSLKSFIKLKRYDAAGRRSLANDCRETLQASPPTFSTSPRCSRFSRNALCNFGPVKFVKTKGTVFTVPLVVSTFIMNVLVSGRRQVRQQGVRDLSLQTASAPQTASDEGLCFRARL